MIIKQAHPKKLELTQTELFLMNLNLFGLVHTSKTELSQPELFLMNRQTRTHLTESID
jgi:hypothetical protein